MRTLKSWARGVVGLAALVMASCGGGSPDPTIVELTMVASQDANYFDGSGLPVQVSLYQFKSPDVFKNAAYGEIANLSGDLLDQYILNPGARQTVVHELSPDARFIGVVASFREINSATWRDTAAIPPNETVRITANIGKASVSFQ